MPTDFRAALERLISAYDEHGGRWPQHDEDALHDAVERARADLAAADTDTDPDPANGENPPPAMLTENELAASWNHQADEFNRWDSLDSGEHLAWAQARAVARDRAARLPDPADGGEALLAAAPLEGEEPTTEELNRLYREIHGLHSDVLGPMPRKFARAVLARWGRPPAPAALVEGEVGKLVAWLRSEADINESLELTDWAAFQRRAATVLECLEQVAYAASDFICGTRFPEFANEHGGIDHLMTDLCRLVAQFEHGPRPVPGVDVPGPDGDWGGLAELCNAEGVDPRIGVPLLQRAREAWKYASQTAPMEKEVGELVADLEADAECIEVEHYDLCSMTADQMRRAATLLQQQAAELASLRAPQGGEVE